MSARSGPRNQDLRAVLGLASTPPWERWAAGAPVPGLPAAFDLARALTPAVFEAAWRRVRVPGGAGVDGHDRAWFERDLARNLAAIRAAVLAGRWRPAPLLRRIKAKPGGGERVLGIPTVADRLVQAAVLEVVGPRADALLRPWVHGYRPGHSCGGAVAQLVRTVGCRPYLELFKADVESLFDNLDHAFLAGVTDDLSPDPLWRSLNRAWRERWAAAPGRGVPQGAPLSPLLANLYLHHAVDLPLERACAGLEGEALGLAGRLRYADDIALVSERPGGGARLLAWLAAALRRARLRLSPRKTVALLSAQPLSPVTVLGIPVSAVRDGARFRLSREPSLPVATLGW